MGETHLRNRAPSNAACAYTCRARLCSCGILEAVFGLPDSRLENNEQQIWRVSKSFCGMCVIIGLRDLAVNSLGVRKIHIN